MANVDIDRLEAHPMGKAEGLALALLLSVGTVAVMFGSGNISYGIAFGSAGALLNWWVVLILRRLHRLIENTERER